MQTQKKRKSHSEPRHDQGIYWVWNEKQERETENIVHCIHLVNCWSNVKASSSNDTFCYLLLWMRIIYILCNISWKKCSFSSNCVHVSNSCLFSIRKAFRKTIHVLLYIRGSAISSLFYYEVWAGFELFVFYDMARWILSIGIKYDQWSHVCMVPVVSMRLWLTKLTIVRQTTSWLFHVKVEAPDHTNCKYIIFIHALILLFIFTVYLNHELSVSISLSDCDTIPLHCVFLLQSTVNRHHGKQKETIAQ